MNESDDWMDTLVARHGQILIPRKHSFKIKDKKYTASASLFSLDLNY